MAAASDRHTARLEFQSASVLPDIRLQEWAWLSAAAECRSPSSAPWGLVDCKCELRVCGSYFAQDIKDLA